MVDDVACYIGSQNLYVCDLAEWGVLIDSAEKVQEVKAQVWAPCWEVSYTRDDCDVDKVMDSLEVDRDAPGKLAMTKMQMEEAKARMRATMNIPSDNAQYYPKQVDGEEDRILDQDSESVSSGEEESA